MAEQRPNLSVTLPASLFHSYDTAPKTPERPIRTGPATPLLAQTSQARFKLRRRQDRTISSQLFAPVSPSQVAVSPIIPSIEIAEDFGATSSNPISPQDDGYLSPLPSTYHSILDAPRTPSAQTASFDGNSWSTAKQRELGESIVRPASAGSTWSESSDDSDSMSTVASSYGTSCTSPERLAGDPFFTPSKDESSTVKQGFFDADHAPPISRAKPKTSWTPAMDDHLWTSYQLYLQDPTATPIKTLPGNAPPLGVCHRVARQAKHTWRESRPRTSTALFSTPQPVGSSKVDMPPNHASSDLEETQRRAKAGTWPKLAHTRRRLRQLSKHRANIAPHYMRLIAGRTPSPFSSASVHTNSRRTSNAPGSARPFSNECELEVLDTRDVRLALVTATSDTMQPDGPLARLQRDTPQSTPDPIMAGPAPAAFNFNEPSVPFASPAMPSSVINHGSSVDQMMPDAPEHPPRLGSPFVPAHSHTWTAPGRPHARGALSSAFPAPRPAASEDSTALHVPRPSTATGPRSLKSPIHFTSSFPYNRSSGSKRRAEHPLEDTTSPRHNSHRRPGLNVDQLFGPPLGQHIPSREGARSPIEQRRVRLRGFSLDDAIMQRQHDRQEASSNENPVLGKGVGGDPFVDERSLQQSYLPGMNLHATAPRVLGSPFRPTEQSTRPRRFKVRHLAHNSLDSYPEDLFGSIGERLEDRQ